MASPWVLAARPRTLPAAAAPVIVGTAVAAGAGAGEMRPLAALACLAGALLLQIGANYANDLSDFRKGADGPGRLGPTRVTAAGLLTPGQVGFGAALAFGLATLVGVYLVVLGGWPIVAIGLSGIVAAVTYVGGPLPYGYRGLGELFVFLYFGLAAVVGTVYVQTGGTTPAAWWGGAAMGAVASAVLVVNNVRDREGDGASGKRTLVVMRGRSFGETMYAVLVGSAALVAALFWGATGFVLFVLPTLYALFAGAGLIGRMGRDDGPTLNPLLGATAAFGLRYALLLSVALVGRSPVGPFPAASMPGGSSYYMFRPEGGPIPLPSR